MSAPLVHYQLEILEWGVPLCENQRGIDMFEAEGDVEMSPFDDEVTCEACLKALGYEQLTEVVGDPLRKARAA